MPSPPGATYRDRRVATLALLGFGSGIPLALTEDTLQAWLRSVGFDLATVGFITIVGLPAALQVLWAPVVDRFAPALGPLARLGRRRAWMLVAQLALIAAIGVMAVLGPTTDTSPLAAFALAALVVAFLSGTQDIAVNAYRADVLPDRLRGAGAASSIIGYRLAMIATGAGVLALADHVSWSIAYACGAAALAIAVAGTLAAPEPPSPHSAPATLREAVVEPLRSFLASPGGIFLLLFVLVFKLPDYLAGRMTVPLLLDLDLTKSEVAALRQAFGLAMTIVGALVGGVVVARLPLMRALLLFGLLQAASNAGFLWLAAQAPGPGIRSAAGAVIAVESFCTGLVAAGFVAFLMACCERRYSATQYALLASVMLAGSKLAGPVAGLLTQRFGYSTFFLITIVAAAPGLAMLPWVRRRAAEAVGPGSRPEADGSG